MKKEESKTKQEQFRDKVAKAANDKAAQEKLRFNIGKYDTKVLEGKKQFAHIEHAKEKARRIKHHSIEMLDRYLLDFERQFNKSGGKVIWAADAESAVNSVQKILEHYEAKSVVKAKSMVTEEILLREHIEKQGIEVLETDLGEYIVQLRNEPPFHIVTPAMHLSKEDVAELFHEKFDTPENATPKQITHFVRDHMRQKFQDAKVGITGANFLVAQTGSVVVCTNEGNDRMLTAFPKVHIAIAGIEKVIPRLEDLEVMLSLLATHGTGQELTVYNTMYNGPAAPGETDGPEAMFVILLDNGRSKLLADPERRETLYCIRCGACLNACPVYKTIGGHSYGSIYSGPIGAAIMPTLGGSDYSEMSEASSLCGACTQVCPVGIDLHGQIQKNRVEKAKENSEETQWKRYEQLMKSRKMMNAPSWAKQFFFKMYFKKSWGEIHELPKFPSKTFHQLYKKRKKQKK